MVCESWKAKVDTYLDGELPDEEMRTFDAHVRSCPSCKGGLRYFVIGDANAGDIDGLVKLFKSTASKV